MPKRQKLQLHQFEVNGDNVIDKEIFVYSWPRKLADLLIEKRIGYRFEFPIKNLSEVITLTIDEVVYTRNGLRRELKQESDYFWIFSLEEINENVLKSRVSEWLIANKLSELTYEELDFDSPQIFKTKDLFEESFKRDLYGLLPHLYNLEFCRGKIDMSSINTLLEFYPVIDTESESVAISNTFECPDRKKEVERFSYAITFKLVNNCEYPDKLFLNVYTGIKVWLNRSPINFEDKKNYIKGDHGHSVYIYKENDYIKNKQKKFVRLMYGRGEGLTFKYWNYSDRQLAKQLDLDLMEPIKNPNLFNEFCDGKHEQVVLLTNNKRTERVKYGAGLPERLDVFRIMADKFPELVLRERIAAIKTNTKLSVGKRKALKELERFNDAQDELEYLDKDNDHFFYSSPPVFIPEGEQVVIEIYSENEDFKNAVIEFTVRILSLTMPVDDYTYRSCDGYEVVFVPKSGNIARGLKVIEQKNKKIRSTEIEDSFKSDSYSTKHVLSLIDIEPFHTSENKEIKAQDPKKLIRKTFKDNARVTQFINNFDPLEKVDKIRLVNAVYDLFSAAGFLDFNFIKCSFDEKILVGLSAVKNSNGKLIALSKIDSGQIKYKVYKLWDKEWLSIHDLLPKLKYYDVKPILKNQVDKNHFNDWIIKQLNGINLGDKECYFFFDASLRNKIWPFAKNGDMNIQKLRLLNADQFKLIRVNTTGEVPEYNIFKNDGDTEGLNRNQGLFTGNNKVFYSVGARPENLQVNLRATRLTHTKRMIGKQRVVEFVTLTDDHDENIWLATQCHALRKLNLTFDASTKYPLPMYVNDRFGEYLDVL